MMKTMRLILTMILALTAWTAATAQDPKYRDHEIATADRVLVSADTTTALNPDLVVINGDTINVKLKEHNFGRHDRGLFNYLIVPKGSWAFGLTASYGELNTDDIEVLSVLSDVSFKGKVYAVRPSVSYFYNHNKSVGLKVAYNRADANLGSLGLDFGEDMNFKLRDVSYKSETYAVALSHRNYVGIGRSGTFAVFNETDLSFTTGSSDFSRLYNDEPKLTHTRINEVSLNFSPGVCVFIMHNVSFNLSFGVFGIKYRREHQMTNGVDEGVRSASSANFRFNIFNINFGLGVHI